MVLPDITIITTGGTIDVAKISSDGVYTFSGSSIPKMLEQWGNHVSYSFVHLPPIDSLLMKDDYRKNILDVCLSTSENRILITHGTDTMVETAQFLHSKIIRKTVILVGAMIPVNQPESDAQMNLGFAIGALMHMTQTWVRIAMNGQLFLPYSVMKDRTTTPPHFRKP